jgi:hypothetical protein
MQASSGINPVGQTPGQNGSFHQSVQVFTRRLQQA